jgi:hypothetical protein
MTVRAPLPVTTASHTLTVAVDDQRPTVDTDRLHDGPEGIPHKFHRDPRLKKAWRRRDRHMPRWFTRDIAPDRMETRRDPGRRSHGPSPVTTRAEWIPAMFFYEADVPVSTIYI